MQCNDLDYVGFWPRVGAFIIDSILLALIIFPSSVAIYGWSYATILFWSCKQATPGKMAISARIVDADTGNTISIGQSIGRYLACLISILLFFLGCIWVAFDPKKQRWHDKLANTVVVRSKQRNTQPVSFDFDKV